MKTRVILLATSAAALLPMASVSKAASTTWVDLTAAAGYEQIIDHTIDFECGPGDCQGEQNENAFVVVGRARVGTELWPDITLQIDGGGTSNSFNVQRDTGSTFDLAGHLDWHIGWLTFGAMGSVGNVTDNHTLLTGAIEGVIPITDQFKTTIQAGYTDDLYEGTHDFYVHGVFQYAFDPDCLLSANIGVANTGLGHVDFAGTGDHDNILRYGVKGEYALTHDLSGFIEWQGIYRVEHPGEGIFAVPPHADKQNDDRILVGVTYHIGNGGNLGDVSSLQDFNFRTGVNNFFEF